MDDQSPVVDACGHAMRGEIGRQQAADAFQQTSCWARDSVASVLSVGLSLSRWRTDFGYGPCSSLWYAFRAFGVHR